MPNIGKESEKKTERYLAEQSTSTRQSTQTLHALFPYITILFLFCGLSGLKIEVNYRKIICSKK